MTGHGRHSTAAVAALNRLFVRALLLAGEAGEAEPACRLAAAGWSALRHDHPREAERLNGAMHALARHFSTINPTNGEHHGKIPDS